MKKASFSAIGFGADSPAGEVSFSLRRLTEQRRVSPQDMHEDRIAELSIELSNRLFPAPSTELDIETIALSALALSDYNPEKAKELRDLLYRTQEKGDGGGGWRPRPSLPCSSWVTSLAMIALAMDGNQECLGKALQWLLAQAGRESSFWVWLRFRFLDRRVHFNPRFYGWPWTEGTLSWVVPTAFGIMATRLCTACQRPREAAQRLSSAVKMLYDRACPNGGWNAGNGVVDGVALLPRLEPTAIALLALRGLSPRSPLIAASLEWVQRQAATCAAPWSLSWAILCCFAYGVDTQNLKAQLTDLTVKQSQYSCVEIAAALLALQAGQIVVPFVMPDEESEDV